MSIRSRIRRMPMGVYRQIQSLVIEPFVLPHWMSEVRISTERSEGVLSKRFEVPRQEVKRAWFHGASVGELESLIPVMKEWAARGDEIVATVLSESAKGAIEKLPQEFEDRPGALLYAGYAPWDGRWGEALEKVRPSLFITAKYEAWPELWASLAERGIPLVVLGARPRRSLRVARRLSDFLVGMTPRLWLLTANEEDAQALRRELGQVRSCVTGEPRWDRVLERSQRRGGRAKQLVEQAAHLPRPWGVLGSVWPEDLDVWRGRLGNKAAGTLWVVPHQVDSDSLEEIEELLQEGGVEWVRSSSWEGRQLKNQKNATHCVLVDEMGFLSELYSGVDWAYVGGGFGEGVHSTIEPAIHAIPISCGPNGAEKFAEIEELTLSGQLQIIEDAEGLDHWLDTPPNAEQRESWKRQIAEKMGASRRVLEVLKEAVDAGLQEP